MVQECKFHVSKVKVCNCTLSGELHTQTDSVYEVPYTASRYNTTRCFYPMPCQKGAATQSESCNCKTSH
jgi:hypothetical protein